VARDLQVAWQWLRKHTALLVLIIIGALSNIAIGPSNVLPPMLIRDALHAGAQALGFFDASIGLGVIVGGLVLGSLPSERVGRLFLAGLGLEGLALGIISMAHVVFVAYAGNFVLGLGLVAANLPTATLLQSMVPDSMRGRITGLGGMLNTVTIPLSYGGIGMLGDTIGARGCFAMAGGLMGGCVALGFATRDIRRLSSSAEAKRAAIDG
jgi:MFS family permease